MAEKAKNSIRDFCAKLRKTVGEDASSPAIMRALGEFAIELIVRRTRLGYGVPAGANGEAERFNLRPLAPATIAGRQRLAGRGRLSDMTTPKRSNLTATGQMLDSMQVVTVRQSGCTIAPTGSRQEGGPSNAEVAAYVAAAGRPFIQLSRLEASQLKRFYRNVFGDLLKNNRIT